MKRKTDDELFFLVDFYHKNSDLTPHKLVKKAQEVDLIRDKFSKSMIYNYYLCFRRYLKDGYICKGLSKRLSNTFQKVCNRPKVAFKPEKQEKVNPLEQIEQIHKSINEEIDKIVEKYEKILTENKQKMSEIEYLNGKLKYVEEVKISELEQKRSDLISEVLMKL